MKNTEYPNTTSYAALFLYIVRVINKTAKLCNKNGIKGWRQSKYRIKKLKKLMRKATSLHRSTSKDKDKRQQRQLMIEAAYIDFINESKSVLEKSDEALNQLPQNDLLSILAIDSISVLTKHAKRQIEQIYRRIILKETIPHEEKVFSIFEEYTEWLSKGKAGVPVELGLGVCVSSDQHGFILGHQVMQKQKDVDVATEIIEKLQQAFPQIYSASFDKGFYSKANQEKLHGNIIKLVMPKKGKLSLQEKEEIKADLEYQKLRKLHSAVESDINAIEVHGLDRCPDRGIKNFKRYVSSAILAHNIHRIGALL